MLNVIVIFISPPHFAQNASMSLNCVVIIRGKIPPVVGFRLLRQRVKIVRGRWNEHRFAQSESGPQERGLLKSNRYEARTFKCRFRDLYFKRES